MDVGFHGVRTGRSPVRAFTLPNDYKAWTNQSRRLVSWEAEGVESSVGILNDSALAFVINGKVDGNSRGDAGTQIQVRAHRPEMGWPLVRNNE